MPSLHRGATFPPMYPDKIVMSHGTLGRSDTFISVEVRTCENLFVVQPALKLYSLHLSCDIAEALD